MAIYTAWRRPAVRRKVLSAVKRHKVIIRHNTVVFINNDMKWIIKSAKYTVKYKSSIQYERKDVKEYLPGVHSSIQPR